MVFYMNDVNPLKNSPMEKPIMSRWKLIDNPLLKDSEYRHRKIKKKELPSTVGFLWCD